MIRNWSACQCPMRIGSRALSFLRPATLRSLLAWRSHLFVTSVVLGLAATPSALCAAPAAMLGQTKDFAGASQNPAGTVNEVVQEFVCNRCEEQYRLVLRSDGRAEKTTKTRVGFALYARSFGASLDAETFNRLAEFLRRERFLELPSRSYLGPSISQGVVKTTTARLDGESRSAVAANDGAPAFLTRISDEVERVANTLRWTLVEDTTTPSPDTIRSISLGRGSMGGVEDITLRSDGTATRTSGSRSSYTGSVTREMFDALTTLLVREGFFALADAYYDPQLADGTWVFTSVATDTATKSVQNANGLGPANLVRIEEAIEATVSATAWTPSVP
jgi:hypothetical protein